MGVWKVQDEFSAKVWGKICRTTRRKKLKNDARIIIWIWEWAPLKFRYVNRYRCKCLLTKIIELNETVDSRSRGRWRIFDECPQYGAPAASFRSPIGAPPTPVVISFLSVRRCSQGPTSTQPTINRYHQLSRVSFDQFVNYIITIQYYFISILFYY